MWLWLLMISTADPAYLALREGRLDDAVALFQLAVWQQPEHVHLRMDLAYTLLRTGERERARDEFEAALRRQPGDAAAELEYAFLCYETRRPAEARRVFQKLSASAEPLVRTTAAAAFEQVDRPLREGIERWRRALALAPAQWSGHEELAHLAEQREEFELAAEQYELAWKLRPAKTELLLALERVWSALDRPQEARAALVAAWRTGPPRVAERARERLNGAIPSETEMALATPAVAAGAKEEAVVHAKEMGLKSLEQSYLADAHRYLTLANQQAPDDAEVQYGLGVVENLRGRNGEAVHWFAAARRSKDSRVSGAAQTAYDNLRQEARGFAFAAWAVPFYSSRWQDMFLYGQMRGEYRLKGGQLTPYVSLRMVGNVRGRHAGPWAISPQYLSETSVIAAGGLQWRIRHNLFAWGEAGQSFSYLGRREDTGFSRPDYRGGLSWLKGWGRLLGAGEAGWFAETGLDPVYASRFQHNLFLYSQTRTGYTLPLAAGGAQVQLLMHWNVTVDRNREWWGNLAEAGPGVRMQLPGLPAGMTIRAEFLRGAHLQNHGNPLRPNYWDFRSGVWYAFSR
ncbi:MAG: tetratricopeptide repeat protein [Bryobacterales bacterium]|nr:tetratricopeptide repeat protein [Bryobacterales bacterium]